MRTTFTTISIGVSNAQTTFASSPAKPSPAPAIQRSPWHSPVPYLFGGLAAMLGLIAFALLILACSYWRLTGREEDRREAQRRDLEKDDSADSAGKATVVYEEKVLVIMAGDEKPTFLATPVCAKIVCGLSDGSEEQRTEKEVDEREKEDAKVKKEDHEEFVMIIDHDDQDHDHDFGENSERNDQ